MTKHFNEMAGFLNNLGRKYNLSTIFNDFVTLSICGYHRTNIQSRLQEKDPANEELYMGVIQKYEDEEIHTFPKILSELQLHIYEHPYSDPLGEYYMEHISNGNNGEFFTPEHLCDMMTLLHVHGEKGTIEKKTAYDPACGSGRMLLSFAKHHPDNYFYGSDLSNSCAKMAVLNFFLNGLRGEVAWMNALTMEWFEGWEINTNGLGIIPIDKERSKIWSQASKSKPPTINNTPNTESKPTQQLTLF